MSTGHHRRKLALLIVLILASAIAIWALWDPETAPLAQRNARRPRPERSAGLPTAPPTQQVQPNASAAVRPRLPAAPRDKPRTTKDQLKGVVAGLATVWQECEVPTRAGRPQHGRVVVRVLYGRAEAEVVIEDVVIDHDESTLVDEALSRCIEAGATSAMPSSIHSGVSAINASYQIDISDSGELDARLTSFSNLRDTDDPVDLFRKDPR